MGKALIMRDGKAKWTDGVPYAQEKYTTIAEGLECQGRDDASFYGSRPYAGKKYRVTWDGVEYICTAELFNQGSSYVQYVVPSPDAVKGDSGSFVSGSFLMDTNWFISFPGETALWFMKRFDEDGHTFTVEEIEEDVRQIDTRCLPAEEWSFELEDGSTVTKKVVVAE